MDFYTSYSTACDFCYDFAMFLWRIFLYKFGYGLNDFFAGMGFEYCPPVVFALVLCSHLLNTVRRYYSRKHCTHNNYTMLTSMTANSHSFVSYDLSLGPWMNDNRNKNFKHESLYIEHYNMKYLCRSYIRGKSCNPHNPSALATTNITNIGSSWVSVV